MAVHSIFADRYSNCKYLAQRRNDDAASYDDFTALQANTIYSCRWMGTTGKKP